MKPTPCPSRLKELIRVVGLASDEGSNLIRTNLRTIAAAFRAKRQGQQSAERFIQLERHFAIKINLEDGSVVVVRDELALALDEIEPPSKIDLIRECPVCGEIFWAGRSDKEACTTHLGRWRKKQQRQRAREREEKRAKEQVTRIKRQAKKELKLSKTTGTILDAIDDRCRTFSSIDDFCYMQLRAHGKHTGMYSKPNVKKGLKYLENLGYLTSYEREDGEMYYTATSKVEELRNKLLYPNGTAHFFRSALEVNL